MKLTYIKEDKSSAIRGTAEYYKDITSRLKKDRKTLYRCDSIDDVKHSKYEEYSNIVKIADEILEENPSIEFDDLIDELVGVIDVAIEWSEKDYNKAVTIEENARSVYDKVLNAFKNSEYEITEITGNKILIKDDDTISPHDLARLVIKATGGRTIGSDLMGSWGSHEIITPEGIDMRVGALGTVDIDGAEEAEVGVVFKNPIFRSKDFS